MFAIEVNVPLAEKDEKLLANSELEKSSTLPQIVWGHSFIMVVFTLEKSPVVRSYKFLKKLWF